ncbi:hypothetical protein HDV00_000942, partial [Rhizophlyctis rosea]
MSEEDQQPVQQEISVTEEEEAPPKKTGRGKMTEQKLANLAKAREARKAQLEAKKKKYPVDKRAALERKMQEEKELQKRIEEEAESKARDIIEKQKLEAELAEYRAWKKEQEELQSQATPATKKKAAPKKTAAPKKAPARKKKVATDDETDEETSPPPTKRRAPGRAIQQKKSNYYSIERKRSAPQGGCDDVYGGGYRYPYTNPAVTGNSEQWVDVTASNISTTTSFDTSGNSSINFTLASNTSFMRTYQSYLRFTVIPKDANGNVITDPAALAAIRTSKQGISALFSQITIRSGSQVLETFEYNTQVAQFLSTSSASRRKWLKISEGFGNDTMFTGSGGQGVEFTMQIYSSLFSNDVALPLPIFAGGLQVEFMIGTADQYVLGGTAPQLAIKDPRLVYCSIVPDPSFVLALTSAVASGRSAWFPATELRTFRVFGNGANEMTYNAAVGNYTSIDSVYFTHWDTATYNNNANDKYLRFSDAGLTSWSITANEIANPGYNRRFHHGRAPKRLETFMVTYLSQAGSIHDLDQVGYVQSFTPGVDDFTSY